METSFSELKQKEVINLTDGKRLGRVCNVVFTYPEGRVQGVVVPGGRGLRFGKGDLFIDICDLKKIGIDVILAEIKSAPCKEKKKGRCTFKPPEPEPPPRPEFGATRRDYGEYE